MWILEWNQQQFTVTRQGVHIGRGANNTIVLQDNLASRRHATVWEAQGTAFIRDDGSTNGTLVNGRRIADPIQLHPGDQIQIGSVIFTTRIVQKAIVQPQMPGALPSARSTFNPLVLLGVIGIVILLYLGVGIVVLVTRPSASPTLISLASPPATLAFTSTPAPKEMPTPVSTSVYTATPPSPVSSLPYGIDLLGVKNYWSYVSGIIADHGFLVNVGNGNLVISAVDQTIPAPGINNVLLRTYNSLSPYAGDFGSGWTSNGGNAVRLVSQANGSIAYFGPTGAIEVFTPTADGFASPPGFHFTLQRKADGTFILTGISAGIQYFFNNKGHLVSISDRNGNTEQYRRNTSDQVTEIVDSAGRRTTVTYNEKKLIIGVRDGAGRANQYNYDSAGRLRNYVNPAGNTTEYRYDASGHLSELMDTGGNRWAFGYGAEGQVILITDPLGHTTKFTYENGKTIVTDANQHNTTYYYDNGGKVVKSVDPNGNAYQFSWDQNLNPIKITSPLGNETRLTWLGNTGLLTSVSDALGNTKSYQYDSNYNPTSITDARGNVARFTYDAAGANILSATQADSTKITFTYDSRGNPLTMTDPNGNAHDSSNPSGVPYRYAYNALGYPTDMYDPLGNHWTYTWDNNTGNLLSIRDAKSQLTQYKYDMLDRLTGIIYADETTVRFSYDVLGNLTSMEDSHGKTVYTYDTAGRVRTEVDPSAPGAIQYGYDNVGNLVSVIRQDGSITSFKYDPADRVVSQSNPFDGGKLITYGYDTDDRLVSITYPNGDRTTYTYYTNDWLQSLLTTASDGKVYNRYDFPRQAKGGYDANGNPLEFTRTFANFDAQGKLNRTTETWKMSYDAMDRLTGTDVYDASGAGQFRVTFLYNPNGLWATRTYKDNTQSQSWNYLYDAASRWTGVSFWDGTRATVSNDANGNQTRIIEELKTGTPPSIATKTTKFEYDAADRLIKVTDPEGNWNTFQYNGFDQIVQVNSSGSVMPKYQHYDLLGMASETQGSVTANYTYDLAGNVRAVSIKGKPSYYLHRDPRGQISHISDELVATIDYCPVGNIQTSGASAGTTVYEPFLSTGLYGIGLEGTWQAGVLLHLGGGEFWPHNSQLNTKNTPAGSVTAGGGAPLPLPPGGGAPPPLPPPPRSPAPPPPNSVVTVCVRTVEIDCELGPFEIEVRWFKKSKSDNSGKGENIDPFKNPMNRIKYWKNKKTGQLNLKIVEGPDKGLHRFYNPRWMREGQTGYRRGPNL